MLFDWTSATKEASLAHVGEGSVMDDDHRELVRRLFAAATEFIEAAHEAAVAGQSADIVAEDYGAAARRLQAMARDIAALAEAAMIVAVPGFNQRRHWPERSR